MFLPVNVDNGTVREEGGGGGAACAGSVIIELLYNKQGEVAPRKLRFLKS